MAKGQYVRKKQTPIQKITINSERTDTIPFPTTEQIIARLEGEYEEMWDREDEEDLNYLKGLGNA